MTGAPALVGRPAVAPRRIDVLRVIDRLNVGGPTHHVLLLSRDLDGRGYRTTLIKGSVAPGEEEMVDAVSASGVTPQEVTGLGRSISPLQDLRAFVSLYRLIRQLRPAVIHTHKSKAGVLGRAAAILAGGASLSVHTFHGNLFRGYFGRLKTDLVVGLERLLARLTDAVVAVSRQQRDELLSFGIGSSSRVHAIPLGLDMKPFRDQPREDGGFREELGFDAEAPLVGMVTRLVPIKGVDLFLRAAAQVSASHPDARFVVVGLGELRDELESLSRSLGLDDRVRFTGMRRDTPRIYGALDLLVLSSHNEGLPVTIIEGVAAGCYVVAAHVGGVPELVTSEEVGRLVPPNDVMALSNAMAAALQSKRQVPQVVRQDFAERYGIDRLTTDIDALYSQLLARRSNGIVRH